MGAAILGKKQNWTVFLSDKSKISEKYQQKLNEFNIDWEQEIHSEEKILQADCVVKSPGIPDKSEIIKKIQSQGIEIISEIEFAYRYTNGKIVAITGSNGKTTTTSLIHHLLSNMGLDAGLVGNIGNSFALQVALEDKPYYVAEISSFQLDGIVSFRPHIAILTNLSPDHLDRYDYKYENYIASKFKITQNQTEEDFFIYSEEDIETQKWLSAHSIKAQKVCFSVEKRVECGAYLEENQIVTSFDLDRKINFENFKIKGKHNIKNAMAAILTADILKENNNLIQHLNDFKGVEHRMEFVAEIDDVTYINDSKATNVDSVFYALEQTKKNIIWIAGGTDKGNDYSQITPLVKEKVGTLICLGLDNEKIKNAFKDLVENLIEVKSMKDAVDFASKYAKKGDTILLSPACASFDLFKNYEDRGTQFKENIKNIKL